MSTQVDYAMLAVLILAVIVPLSILATVSLWLPNRFRFSTRTLLIVTTVLAAWLGSLAYLLRK
jgi:hypothetical protein